MYYYPYMSISVIVPAKNEEKNLPNVINYILTISVIDQIVLVEGNSSDNTWLVAKELERKFPGKVQVIKQNGFNKFDAVQCGISVAVNDQIMIWDADNTINIDSQIELINFANDDKLALWTGNRLKGVRNKGSMHFFNLLGNHAFSIVWLPFTGMKKIDTLCGSKIFPKTLLDHCPKIIIKHDPFGDFSILAAAFKRKIPINAVTVNYLARTYGSTNIHRWRNGFQLLYIYILFLISLLFRILKK